ncbi:MAG: hypothetical protein IPF99_28670 [Deltaproteobacteria bacterium]|nr:hypothetical protein [Deltaproteobacteria bacterium]
MFGVDEEKVKHYFDHRPWKETGTGGITSFRRDFRFFGRNGICLNSRRAMAPRRHGVPP